MKIHLLRVRGGDRTNCGRRAQPGAFTRDFREVTCKTCLRNMDPRLALSGPVGINVARLLGIELPPVKEDEQ